jgi:hypothetical protein
MINEYGAVGGMRIGGGNQSTWWNPPPVPFCPPQIPYDLTWGQTQAMAMRSQQLTTTTNLLLIPYLGNGNFQTNNS